MTESTPGFTSAAKPAPADASDCRPARLRARLAAGAVDLLVVTAAVSAVGQPFPPILALGIFVVYHATLTWWTSRTLGKALLGLRVLRPGKAISAWWALARAGPGYLLLGLGGLGLLTTRVDRHGRALYDIALGGAVVQETDAVRRPRGLLDRLLEYAHEHQRVASERKKTLTVLLAFWAWLAGVGNGLKKVLDWLRGSQVPAGPSALSEVSSAAAAATAATATAVAAAVVAVVPQTEAVGAWLVTDRYWVGAGAEAMERAADPELLVAADRGDVDAVRSLLQSGADPDLARDDGWTSLHFAAQNGHADVVRELLDTDATVDPTNDEGWAPLTLAAQNGHDDVVRLLLGEGADPDQATPEDWTPLHAAAQRGHTDAVEALLEEGGDPDAARDDGWTPLHFAAQNGHADVVRELLDTDATVDPTNDEGWAPLTLAAQNGHDDVVRLLLGEGADPDQATPEDWTPLHAAAQRGHTEVVEALLDADTDRSPVNAHGETPADLARRNGHTDVVEILQR